MKATLFTTATVALLSLPAFAQDMAGPDTDGDGLVTLMEAQTAYPELSQDDFDQADANADGFLDGDELQAAMDGGLIPATDG
ncbi:hypothetical protein [Antarctobacter heliothermus]|uniref:EF hand n=1 Tax=Antarctobacter heliothermus TaxID=74033 RepID=A0A239FNU9_9RHOB|nr:hypothetical protein [Antarctobacter heliothermus]SNS58550.1 EF hand [Antarctobacter heliothermus]